MKDIKTKQTVRDIKAFDRSANVASSMKNACIRTKEQVEQTQHTDADSPTGYAMDEVTEKAQNAARGASDEFRRFGDKKVNEIKYCRTQENNPKHAGNSYEQSTSHGTRKGSHSGFSRSRQVSERNTMRGRELAREHAKTTERGIRQSRKAVKTGTGSSVKAAQSGMKTAKQSSRAAVKTTQAAAKTAQATARNAQMAAQAAKATAKATIVSGKAVAKAVATAVKCIIAATKSLIAAIAAGGWVAVVIIVIICLVGLLAGSCFGIFFSGEDIGSAQTIRDAVSEINEDYDSKLSETKAAYTFDVLEMSGSRAVWKEVLALYAIKTTTDPVNPQEVTTMTDEKNDILKSIFWEMNEISAQTETKTEKIVVESDNGSGNIVQKEITVTRTYLYITVSHKTADEMSDKYAFNEDQREQLAQLLDEENSSLWSYILYGITESDNQIVAVAISQIGNIGGEPYWSWYGFDSRVEWCACFVSWCANECGYIDIGVIPKFAGVSTGINWFKERGQWQDGGFEPSSGDIIFFDWENDGSPDHVGIVEKCEGGIVYTIEGNSSDSCVENTYPVGSCVIYGYGLPKY